MSTLTSPANLSRAAQLSDQDLLVRVKLLVRQEREATAELVAHLAVLDERRLYLAEGCSSLFTYCTQVLHLSEHAAYGRIEAARAARRFPVILGLLSEGSVNLTTVGLLAARLTAENQFDLLEAARHRSKREVEELVARLHPQPPVSSSIRKLPSACRAPASTAMAVGAASTPGSDTRETGADLLPPSEPPASMSTPQLAPSLLPAAPSRTRPAVVVPLSPERYKVQCTVTAETHAKLRLAQDLLRHQIPDGDLGQVIDQALTVLLRDLTKQKLAATDRPRRKSDRGDQNRSSHDRGDGAPMPGSRHIPAEVRRTVWARDGGRCAFVARNGRRCTERGFLEFHHVFPYSAGGKATADNIELRCGAHNGHEAELYFGSAHTPVVKGLPDTSTSTRSGPS